MGFLTYKQSWTARILRQLGVDRSTERQMRDDLKKMSGHGLARLSIAIEDRLEAAILTRT